MGFPNKITKTCARMIVLVSAVLVSGFAGANFIGAADCAIPAMQGETASSVQRNAEPDLDADGVPSTEIRSGNLVGKARILEDGGIAFKVTPNAGVFRNRGATFEVVVPKDATISFFADPSNAAAKKLSVKDALAKLNAKPTLVSISGNFDANTNTFHAAVALEIVA